MEKSRVRAISRTSTALETRNIVMYLRFMVIENCSGISHEIIPFAGE
jgi:hypothetical protein